MKETELENQNCLPGEEQYSKEDSFYAEDEQVSFGCTLDNDIRELMHLDQLARDDN